MLERQKIKYLFISKILKYCILQTFYKLKIYQKKKNTGNKYK